MTDSTRSGTHSPHAAPANLDKVLLALRACEPEFRSKGALHMGVYGSVARGKAHDLSDVDIIVELDPAARVDLFAFIGLKQRLEDILRRTVDLTSAGALRPGRDDAILREIVRAF